MSAMRRARPPITPPTIAPMLDPPPDVEEALDVEELLDVDADLKREAKSRSNQSFKKKEKITRNKKKEKTPTRFQLDNSPQPDCLASSWGCYCSNSSHRDSSQH
jgi:hypothetical protein